MVKRSYTSDFAIKEMNGRIIILISGKRNLENKAFQMGFMHVKIKLKEKFELKTKLTKTEI